MTSLRQFGPYDLVERISVGGMAEVFKAINRTNQEVVALKKVLPAIAEDEEFINLFNDEVRLARHLDHPNVAKIIDLGERDDSHYIAMEFIEGHPFRMLIDRCSSNGELLPLDVVVFIMSQVCQGLDYAHDLRDDRGQPLNIVHRDVSPQNVMLGFDGRVKLIDFGIAKAAGKITRTRAGSIKGKFGYMSPEQVRGLPLDRRSDVFSLGICLWEALTLCRLFDGPNELMILEQIRSLDMPPPSRTNPACPPELDRIVLKALAKEVEERYGTASELDADLRAFAQSSGNAGDAGGVAGIMQRMFPADAATAAAHHREKREQMGDKGGSDLDVFDGLTAKKKPRPPAPAPSAPGPGGPPRQKTLLGLAAPVPPPPAPSRAPGLPSSKPGAPPPTPPSVRSGAPAPPTPPRAPAPPTPSRGPVLPPPSRAPAVPSSGPQPPRPPVPSRPPAPPPLSKPPTPPPSAAEGPPVPVEMDWDDEDEKTAIYDKASNEDAARALLRTNPPPAPPPAAGTPAPAPSQQHYLGAPPPASGAAGLAATGAHPSVPPSFPRPAAVPGLAPPHAMPAPMPPSMGPAVHAAPATIPPAAPASRTALVAIAALLAVILVVAVVVLLLPGKGSLLVTVAGPGGKPLDKVEVFVDGTKKCESSPCRVTDLKTGSHVVTATAAGYRGAAPQAVAIERGAEAVLNLSLGVATEGTGFRVTAEGTTGLRLYVNGKDKGPLPQELNDMRPGDYNIKIAGNDAFEPYEKTIAVKPDELLKLDLTLKVKKGLAEIKRGPGADGAEVYLVTGNERRRLTNKLPIKLSISTDKPYKIVAKKRGFSDYRKDVVFEDNQAEKSFVIQMVEVGKAPPPAVGGPLPGPRPGPVAGPAPAPAPAPGAMATVNVNSIPVSSVILNGRPLGTTPKTGVKVKAGPVTAVFVHPEHGRKVRSTVVKPGGTATLVVRFP